MTRRPAAHEAVPTGAAFDFKGGNAMTWTMPRDVPSEEEALAAYDKWCEANPGECTLCNPHICDDYCPCEEGA